MAAGFAGEGVSDRTIPMLTVTPSLTTTASRKVPVGTAIPNPDGYLGIWWHAQYGDSTIHAGECPLRLAYLAMKQARELASIPPETDDEIARGVAHAVMMSVCGMGG